jgi:hypothetical protein
MTSPNIRIKRSAIPGKRPSNSQMELGELALNTNDGRLFTKKENVGIGTTVTLLNVWTENVGGGVYYNDGSVGIGTSIPTSLLELYTSDGNIKLGDITAQPTTDVGISFSGLGTYTSAIFTELDGQILSYGINTPQIQNPRNTGRVGGIFRLDSRPPGGLGDSSCFVIKYAPVGFATTAGGPENGIKNGLILSLQDGKTYLVPDEGNVLVGLKTDTGTLNQKLQVLGGAYVSGNIGVGTTNPIGLFQVGSASTQSVAINEFGRVGIGTTNPITRLDLIGVARVGGNDNLDVYTLTYADPSVVDVISIESINRENTIKKNLALNAYGGNVLIGSASLTGTNSQPFQVTGGAYVSGNIGVGTTNPTSKLQVDGNATINGNLNVAIGGTFPIISTLIGEASGYNASGIAVTQTRYGIGIGTTNPFIPFYSDSDTQITNTFTFYNTEWIAANSYNNSVTRIGADSGRSIEIGMGNTDLPKYIDFGGGNFPGLLYPDWQARILRNGTDDGSLQILSRGSGTVSISAGQTSGETGNFDIFTANTRRLRVSSTGNIGLNVLNPTSRLHVVGDTLVTGVVTATTFVGTLSGTATSTVNIPNLTGDVTSNNTVTTLATVNSSVGTFGGTGAIPVVTVNGKGLVTGVTTVAPNNGTLTLSVSGTGLSGSSTFTANQAGNSTFTVTSNATSDNTNSTIVARNGSGGFVAGVVTATQFSTGSGNVAIGTNIITGPAEITIDPAAVGDNTGAVRIKGDLYVDGTQTIINSSTIELADFNVGIATTVGTNLLLDGAGIGIGSSAIRKTITWNNSASALTSSEDWNLVSGKQYEINGTSVLSSTTLGSGVVNSSLTSVGTLNNLNVSGVSTSLGGFIGNLTGNLNSSGVNTATNISGTTLTYTNGSITNISGTNLNYTGISTVTNVRSTTINNTGVGTITTLNSTTGTITNLSGTNVSYSGIGTVGSLNIGSTQVISSGRQLQNIASLDATTTATIETAIANAPNTFTDLQVTGLSTFTNGPVLIGTGTSTGTASQRLQVTGGAYVSESIGIGTTNPTSKLYVVGDVLVSGVITSTDYNSASDINLKENIQPISNPIDKVLQINGVSFDWKEDGRSSMGVIAQEIEKVMPEIVSGGDSKTVNYNGLIGLLIEVVKEQQQRINSLEERLK